MVRQNGQKVILAKTQEHEIKQNTVSPTRYRNRHFFNNSTLMKILKLATSNICSDVFTFLTQWGKSASNFVAISSLVVKLLKKCWVRYRVGHPVLYVVFKNTYLLSFPHFKITRGVLHCGWNIGWVYLRTGSVRGIFGPKGKGINWAGEIT